MQKQFRLKKRAAFAYVYRKGEKASARDLLLLSAKSKEGLKIGLSVSKKVGNSVERNRCKRRLKAAYTPFLPLTQPGRNLIFIARREALFLPFDRMQKEICKALQKAGLYKEEPAGEVSP